MAVGQYLKGPKQRLPFQAPPRGILVEAFYNGFSGRFLVLCAADVYIYDSQGYDLSGFYKEGNRRDSSGCIMAVEDGV